MSAAKTWGVRKQSVRQRGQFKEFGCEEGREKKVARGRTAFSFKEGRDLSMFDAVRMEPVMREGRKTQMREERIKRMRGPRMRKRWIPEHQWRRNISQGVRHFFFHCKKEGRMGGETQMKLGYSPVITKSGCSHQENFHFSQ